MRPAAAQQAGATLRIGGAGAGLMVTSLVADAFESARPGVEVQIVPYLASSGGLKALEADVIDVAIVARPFRERERVQGFVTHEYARSPFVFTARQDTAVDEVTLEAVVAAYAGRMETWPDGSPLRLVLRPLIHPDTGLLRGISGALALAVEAAHGRPGHLVTGYDKENLDTLEQVPGSFGTAILGQIISEGRRLKPLALDGVAPTLAALAAGTYRHEKAFRLATSAAPKPLAREFTAFAATPEAQAILAACGFGPPAAAG